MHEDKDIFDSNKIKNLPLALIEELSKEQKNNGIRLGKFNKKIYDLFNTKECLTVNEILVGLFRLYKSVEKRKHVQSALHSLVNYHKLLIRNGDTWSKSK